MPPNEAYFRADRPRLTPAAEVHSYRPRVVCTNSSGLRLEMKDARPQALCRPALPAPNNNMDFRSTLSNGFPLLSAAPGALPETMRPGQRGLLSLVGRNAHCFIPKVAPETHCPQIYACPPLDSGELRTGRLAVNSGKMPLNHCLTSLRHCWEQCTSFAFVIKGERQMVPAITKTDESIKIILRPSPVAL